MDDATREWYDKMSPIWDQQDSMMRHAEMVPLHVLKRLREYSRRPGEGQAVKDPETYNLLKQHIMAHGITSPVWIDYHPELGVAHLSEGNHRLAIAEDLGMTHLPAVVYRSRRRSNGGEMPLTDLSSGGGQYRRPSEFPELESTGKPPPNFRTAAYHDFQPNTGYPPHIPQEWDDQREEFMPREHGLLGVPPTEPFHGSEQNDYRWESAEGPFGDLGGPHTDHRDENVIADHWKDRFPGVDSRPEWDTGMAALRQHSIDLAREHGIETIVHPEWTDMAGPSDQANPDMNKIHIRPVTNRMRYLVALHEMAHNVGGTEADWEQGVTSYGVPPHNPRRVPLNYDRSYKPKGYDFDGQKGMYPGRDEPGFKYPQEWEIAKDEWLPDVEEHVPTSPYTEEENKLETEARAWDWAIQHSAVKVTPALLRQMYRYLTSYADPKEIGHYSPTFKRLWEEGEHPENGEGWSEEWTPQKGQFMNQWHYPKKDKDNDVDYPTSDEVSPDEIHQMEPYNWTGFRKPLTWHNPTTGEIWELPNDQHEYFQPLMDSWEARGRPNAPFDPTQRESFIPYVPSKATQTPSAGFPAVSGGTPFRRGQAAAEWLTEGQAHTADYQDGKIMYHVAPARRRNQIMAEGLRPDADLTQPSGHERGVYLWDSPETAHRYKAQGVGGGDSDIWRVNVGNMPMNKDWYVDDIADRYDMETGNPNVDRFPGAHYVTTPISPDRVQMHSINPWDDKFLMSEQGQRLRDIEEERDYQEALRMQNAASYQGDIVKTTDWHEDDHPRSGATGKFTVKEDVHQVKMYDKNTGKHTHTVKRCDKCGVLYGEKPGKTVTSCPTCGEHPKRHSSATVHTLDPSRQRRRSLDQGAVADSLGWQYWKNNENGHAMYRWSGPSQFGGTAQHIVTGYGNHGQGHEDQDWNGEKVRRNMRSCMNGTCDHVGAPQSVELHAPAQVKAPVIRGGSEVMYGGKAWWVMEVDGGLAHIYDATGAEDIVPQSELRAAASNQDRIERNKRFVEQLEDKWEDMGNTRDPDFVFVFFGGKLVVEAWEPNLRVRGMADQLIKEHGFMALEDYETFAENDSTSRWVTGEVWKTEAGNLKVEITQLADPDIIAVAREAVEHYFGKADDAPDYTRLVHPQWLEVSGQA